MLRMSEQHPDKGSMNDDKKRMESVAPVTESTGASGRGRQAGVVKKRCRLPSVLLSRKEAERDACSGMRSRILSRTVYPPLMVRSTSNRYFQGDQKHAPRPPFLQVVLVEWKDVRGREEVNAARAKASSPCESEPTLDYLSIAANDPCYNVDAPFQDNNTMMGKSFYPVTERVTVLIEMSSPLHTNSVSSPIDFKASTHNSGYYNHIVL